MEDLLKSELLKKKQKKFQSIYQEVFVDLEYGKYDGCKFSRDQFGNDFLVQESGPLGCMIKLSSDNPRVILLKEMLPARNEFKK